MSTVVVLGAAGFLGSHLCDRLVARGETVIGLDDLTSGRHANLEQLKDNAQFSFFECDVSIELPHIDHADAILHFASPASPPRYIERQIHTLRTGSRGTENALEMATRLGARLIMASTSEVYGEPLIHPQPETYRGNVSSTGIRSCYDEAKRFSEAICMAFARERGTDVGIVRIFNTYGPRLDRSDGRVVSNFIWQALRGEPLTMYGDGRQTRSFCYVDDEVAGIMSLMDSPHTGPINVGNPNEFTMLELAELVLEISESSSEMIFKPLPEDDPTQRCPDISLARELLDWEPRIQLREGLEKTISWFRTQMTD